MKAVSHGGGRRRRCPTRRSATACWRASFRPFACTSTARNCRKYATGFLAAVTALARGGRLCVLSYHSVEDREVKEVFRDFERDCICPPELPVCICGRGHRALKKISAKPIEASPEEVSGNPRARSAKLRVMEKGMSARGFKLALGGRVDGAGADRRGHFDGHRLEAIHVCEFIAGAAQLRQGPGAFAK